MSTTSAGANLLSQINNTEIVEKKVDVDLALNRMRKPLDSTTLNIEVYGVYSLPDTWKSKIVSVYEKFKLFHLEINRLLLFSSLG